MRTLIYLMAILLLGAMVAEAVQAESQQYCVACKDPDKTYICQVDTPHANPSDKGMQLYCIIQTSKDGGHQSCEVRADNPEGCAGTLKSYSFQAPTLPPELRSTVNRLRNKNEKKQEEQTLPPQKGGEPETLIDLTGRAVRASRKGLSNTGEAVSGATGKATGTVGKAARGVGKGVTKAAGKVGSATKKTGGAVGSAAKTAFDCVKSLFKDCSSKKPDAPPASQ